jgi:transcriptional activator for dhaKLM operon
MQPDAYPVQWERLREVWRSFVETGQLDPEESRFLDPAVLQSWRRCLPRLDYSGEPHPKSLREASLEAVQRAHSTLSSVAAPVMEDIHQFIEGSDCAILLADGSACILDVVGDAYRVRSLQQRRLSHGTYWSEGQMGTNAIGVVRITAMPMQVVGPEHYFRANHELTTTAAPIHDVRGRIVGILGIVGSVHNASSHTLGLVMTAARAISNQLQTDWYVEEANRHLTEVRTVLSAISEGIISWNENGIISHVNATAGEILQLNPASIVGRPFTEALPFPPLITDAAANRTELRDVDTVLQLDGHSAHCLVSLRPVFEGQRYIGNLVMLRPIEHVRRLVHQQIGVKATLSLDNIASSSQSSAMRAVLRQARIAARGTAPVLIRGEGGVGKNHLARAIHNDGMPAEAPFIAINCQAIPHELMISEFLGHDEQGNRKSRPSKFELAAGGTLLLDQVEHLSLEMQAAILHLIETGHIMRLGSRRSIAVDVRIIAASTADLQQRVQEGSFLPHLYYRFGVFNITIPPLREREEDIPLLAERFLARITRTEKRAAWISDDVMAILNRYPWPGNVRELESVLERALNHSNDGTVRLSDLPHSVREGRVITGNSPEPQPLLSIAEAEREAIIRAGWACEGQPTKMAEQLGIGRTTLWRKMKQYNISSDLFKSPPA